MVFQNNRKRRKPIEKPTKSIRDLPDELLLNIFEHATITDILRCREASKLFVPASTTAIRSKLKVLYVHPSHSSLRKAVAICHSDLSSEIEEICFVNKTHWHMQRGKFGFNAHTWPRRLLREKTDILHPGAGSFTIVYATLLSALTQLKNLDTFSFASSCMQPGFNMISQSQVLTYAAARHTPPHKSLLGPPEAIMDFSDRDAITSMLKHPEIKFRRLRIAAVAPVLERVGFDLQEPHSISKLQFLSSFEYHCSTRWSENLGASNWLRFALGALQLAAKTLRSLVLVLDFKSPRRGDISDRTLNTILMPQFDRLEHLEVHAQLPRTSRRPLFFMMNMVSFLQRCGTIRDLRVSNVIFHHADSPWDATARVSAQIRDIVTTFRERKGDRKLSWKINHYMHDERCRHAGTEERYRLPQCKSRCGFYIPTDFRSAATSTGEIERLAQELDVELREPEKVWQFGTVQDE